MGVDALSLKQAPEDQKKAFLFLLDNFEKVDYSWAGAGRFAKYAALDPTNYVGLGTLGVGAAAAEGARLTTAAGIKAALKVGLIGGMEGAAYGGAQQRMEQEARVNTGGQDAVDYGKVALGAGVGGGLGFVLAPLITVGMNGLGRNVAKDAAKEGDGAITSILHSPTDVPHTEYTTQPSLDLGNMANPNQAAQASADAAARNGQLGVPETATQPTLPGFAQNDLSKAVPFNELPLEGRVDARPDFLMPAPQTTITEEADRLMAKWKVQEQADLFPNHTPDPRLPASAKDGTIKLESSTAQGSLFDRLPEVTSTSIDDAVSKAAELNTATAGSPLSPAKGVFESVPKPKPTEKIGGTEGPNLMDLKRLLNDVGSTIKDEVARGWTQLTDVSDPLARALMHMTPEDARNLARQFSHSAMTQDEFKGYTAAAINAQNSIKRYVDGLLSDRALSTTPEAKKFFTDKIVVAERIMDPLKTLAKEAGTTSGTSLVMHRQNLFKGLQRDINLDSVLKDMGLDRLLATDDQKADAIQKWFTDMVDKTERLEKIDKLVNLKRELSDAITPQDYTTLAEAYHLALADVKRTELGGMSAAGQFNEARKRWMADTGSFLAHTVLSPSSLTVGAISNSAMVFSRPTLDFIARGADKIAFKQMTSTYGAMFRVSNTAFAQARLAFETERALLTGLDPKWVENGIKSIESETGQSNITKFMGRNAVRIWTRLLNATDEFFQVVSYQGFVEGNAVAKAMLAAKDQGLDKAATDALVKDYVKLVLDNAYTKNPDNLTIGILRETGIKKGYSGDNLKLYIQNQLDENPKLLRRATDEEGISYTNDLLFKREFSGDNTASTLAKNYEAAIRAHPELRIMGQLFFRTPVRVFEAGMRLTPGVQYVVPKFWDDLAGKNGMARELRARGEMLVSYGVATSIITAFATGTLTGSGYNLSAPQKDKLTAAGWRPYSLKVGEKYVNYRNYDPIATPVKIIVNAMERLQKMDIRIAQGEIEHKTVFEDVFAYVGLATASILQSVQDANLTSGITDAVKAFEMAADPERKENSFKQFVGSKAQLLVPNAVRRGVKFFGEGQNVQTDASTMSQVMEAIINPASDRVTDKFDALGNKASTQQQGFFPYIGIDAQGREARSRGLGERDVKTLDKIANLTFKTGQTFTPSPKIGNIDLKEEMTADGTSTLFNKVMREFNKNMPDAAASFFEKAGHLPIGRKGTSPQGDAFSRVSAAQWKAAIAVTARTEPSINKAVLDQLGIKQDVQRGNREVGTPSFLQ
jgi:hypothetical protein